MDYQHALEYLYIRTLDFTTHGAKAYKPGLHNIKKLCECIGNPHLSSKAIHIAGTNGKGSTSHFLSSIFMEAGYKTGLYTSPHLKKFNERIKINGKEISDEYIVNFVNQQYQNIESINPSFFEITTAMAFKYFADNEVDIAIIEVGLGGRLDATNIIQPQLTLITQIGYDHADILGNTLPMIAREKAGIMKEGVPVIVSEYQPDIWPIFEEISLSTHAPIYHTNDILISNTNDKNSYLTLSIAYDKLPDITILHSGLAGIYQLKNLKGVICAAVHMREQGYNIADHDIINGIKNVIPNTQLKGRWQVTDNAPLTVCDVAHNVNGVANALTNLQAHTYTQLYIIFGASGDKDVEAMMALLPDTSKLILTQANNSRAVPTDDLYKIAIKNNLHAISAKDVNMALKIAKSKAERSDMILILGSIYLVAELDTL
ncbi:MAG: folylpolyglutamate synthase/dihydrofolate synthase family protein [Cytophagales bacterium]|nr:folylpolyglutamate synthase/dihydrofolate synthase family protein [Cytophagales bacterium]